jgi:hypothetical protein
MSISTITFYSRLGRRARGGDFTRLALIEQRDLIDAGNSALMQLYNALPTYFKVQTQGFILASPVTLSLSVVNGSSTFGSPVFTAAQIGCSIVIPGDAGWNQIISTTQLLNPYLGPTGTALATIYGDAVYSLTAPLDRVIGNPRYASQPSGLYYAGNELVRVSSNSQWLFRTSVGRPTAWWLQSLPDQAYALDIPISFWPLRLTYDDYTANTILPVPDQFIETALIPLGLQALMTTPIWQSQKDEDRIDEAASRAMAFLKSQPAQQAPNNRIGTPPGF